MIVGGCGTAEGGANAGSSGADTKVDVVSCGALGSCGNGDSSTDGTPY
jgi:hypothetical protein